MANMILGKSKCSLCGGILNSAADAVGFLGVFLWTPIFRGIPDRPANSPSSLVLCSIPRCGTNCPSRIRVPQIWLKTLCVPA